MASLIVGGNVATPGRYPYIAALASEFGKFPQCGGTLISPKLVLTAAHCADCIEVFIGCFNLLDRYKGIEEMCERHRVKDTFIHPRFGRTNDVLRFDVAVIVLEKSSRHKPISFLPSAKFIIPDKTLLDVAGWGTTGYFEFNRPITLRETTVQVIDSEVCNDMFREEVGKNLIKSDMLCAALPGQDACQADSGGPAIIPCETFSQDLILGVVSWGFGCADPKFPGVYTRLPNVQGFISEIADDNSEEILFLDDLEGFCSVNGTRITSPPIESMQIPKGWTCNDFAYASLDGCHCNCGVIDPDCFNDQSSSRLFNCPSGQVCSNFGTCQLPTDAPSFTPTVSPTTKTPSNNPTTSPSQDFTSNQPSLSPSEHFTSNQPSLSPSEHSASNQPSISPVATSIPSEDFTVAPSIAFTFSPTNLVSTKRPTIKPTFRPTRILQTTSPNVVIEVRETVESGNVAFAVLVLSLFFMLSTLLGYIVSYLLVNWKEQVALNKSRQLKESEQIVSAI